jgi:hypothetical protein
MAFGYNYIAVEEDPQAMVLKERVLQLEEKENPNLKMAKFIGYETVEANAVGGSQFQGGSQSQDAGASRNAKDDTVFK